MSSTAAKKYPTVQTNHTFYSTTRANPQYDSNQYNAHTHTPLLNNNTITHRMHNGSIYTIPVNNDSNGHTTPSTNISITSDNHDEPQSPLSPHSPISPGTRTRAYSVDLAQLQITRRIGDSSTFQIGTMIIKLCTGAGLLGLPYAFDRAGVLTSILLTCMLSIFACISCYVLLQCREIMLVTKQHFVQSESLYDRKSYHTLPRSDSENSDMNENSFDESQSAHDSFGELAYYCLGHTGTLLVDGSLIISFLGAVAIYCITVTQLLSEIYPNIHSTYFTILCTIILLPFALIRELSWLNNVTVLATVAYIIGFIVIFWYGFDLLNVQKHNAQLESDIIHHTAPINYVAGSISGIMSCFGILTFSLDTPTMVFMFEEEMQQPEKFKSTLITSMCIVCVALISIGTLGVILFHNTALGVQSIIISNLPSTGYITTSVKLAVALTLLFSAPLSLSPALNLLQHVCTGQHTPACHEPNTSDIHIHDEQCGYYNKQPWYYSNTFINCTRIIIHFIVILVAFTVPNFTFIMSILGCVTFALLCYILPPLFYIILHRRDATQLHRHYLRVNQQKYNDHTQWSLHTYYVLTWIYLIVGTVCSVVASTVVLTSS